MKMILIGTAALLVAVGAVAAQPMFVSYATSLPVCVSKSSPILDPYYGYDDRHCSQNLIEGRAAAEGSPVSSVNYATSLPACVSRKSPILDPHYGYDDRVCGQSASLLWR
jgi:hypothetical protein